MLVVGVENQKYLFHAATCRFLDAHRQPASAYGVLGDVLWRLISRRLPELAFALIFSSPFSEGPGVSAGERAIASAVLRLGLPLEQVPERLRSELVCLAAVRRSTAALAHVPEDPRMQPVFLEVVKRYGDLNLVPPSMRDLEVCAAAVQRDSDAWYLVPPELTNRLRTRLAATSDVASSSRPLTLKTFK
ncbi:MAG TPA: hypothetical protein VEB64_12870 [Azospirillaceae bacterium]|nr:hypothetical protein [Azospirillaceae bacterium]